MNRSSRSLVLAFVPVLLLAMVVRGDDAKPSPVKGRQLPPNWGKIGLSEEQKNKVYTIQGEYRTKMEALAEQIAALRKKMNQELEAVLTDGQKARLKEIYLEKVPGGARETQPPIKPAPKPEKP